MNKFCSIWGRWLRYRACSRSGVSMAQPSLSYSIAYRPIVTYYLTANTRKDGSKLRPFDRVTCAPPNPPPSDLTRIDIKGVIHLGVQ